MPASNVHGADEIQLDMSVESSLRASPFRTAYVALS
jgi:hypothetical protein